MSRKIPNELTERIEFAESLLRSARLTADGLDHTLKQIAAERKLLDEREARARADADKAPAMAERAEKMLWAAKRAKQQILTPSSGPSVEPAKKRRARLEATVAQVHKKRAALAKLETELEDQS